MQREMGCVRSGERSNGRESWRATKLICLVISPPCSPNTAQGESGPMVIGNSHAVNTHTHAHTHTPPHTHTQMPTHTHTDTHPTHTHAHTSAHTHTHTHTGTGTH